MSDTTPTPLETPTEKAVKKERALAPVPPLPVEPAAPAEHAVIEPESEIRKDGSIALFDTEVEFAEVAAPREHGA